MEINCFWCWNLNKIQFHLSGISHLSSDLNTKKENKKSKVNIYVYQMFQQQFLGYFLYNSCVLLYIFLI